MKIVFSIGGSILVPGQIDKDYFQKISKFLRDLAVTNKVAVVAGGGRLARSYIEFARDFNASEAFCDLVGISASQMNAQVLAIAIGDKATIEPPKSFLDARRELDSDKIVVMGGTHPGHSTDAVAALFSEYIDADLLINASNTVGIYDKDPREFADAKLFDEVPASGLVELVSNKSMKAGGYELIDLIAAKIIERSGIRVIFLDGREIDNLRNAVSGRKFQGTIITK